MPSTVYHLLASNANSLLFVHNWGSGSRTLVSRRSAIWIFVFIFKSCGVWIWLLWSDCFCWALMRAITQVRVPPHSTSYHHDQTEIENFWRHPMATWNPSCSQLFDLQSDVVGVVELDFWSCCRQGFLTVLGTVWLFLFRLEWLDEAEIGFVLYGRLFNLKNWRYSWIFE